jgi:hypothetical protein
MIAVATAHAGHRFCHDRSPRGRSDLLRGWLPMLTLPAGVLLLIPASAPPAAVMWLLAFALYGSCKWVTWRRAAVTATRLRHLTYLLAWPGMNADRFLSSGHVSRPAAREVLAAAAKLALGVIVYAAAVRAVGLADPLLVGWLGMTGVVLMLHFGLFHLLSCCCRACGVDADPLMDRPLASSSLSEFWGRRWNSAFRDLTHRFVFRPCARRFGNRTAVAVSFVVSGVIHDLVISVPAGAGFGGPTAFFVVQGAGVLIERSALGKRLGITGGWRGRIFAAACLIGPLALLFHPVFVARIILPQLAATGALL